MSCGTNGQLKEGWHARSETQDRSFCLPGAEATAGTLNSEILTNCWGQSEDNQERMKFPGAIVIGGSNPLVSFFSRNPTRLSQWRWWKTWRSPPPQWFCLGPWCSVSWLPYWTNSFTCRGWLSGEGTGVISLVLRRRAKHPRSASLCYTGGKKP